MGMRVARPVALEEIDDGVALVTDPYVADHDLTALFRQSCQSLIGMVWVLLGDRGAAEEVVQDAFISLQRAWPTMQDRGRALGYLRATSLNLVRSRLRHRLVVLRHPPAPAAEVASAEDSVILSDDRLAVVTALRRLPVRQRECLVLRYYAEMTEAEISSALGISSSSVKTHLRRGMAALESALEARA
jgi:RNA polymerase sigma-70 factor (sigma-E family)